ncbi:DUF1428 domain-containing protein [Roseomonas eburnea]|uniref:DUF1428 domain-containing protein n=1 Tax=Neoroseomonas eburnea TaxID=1346889 RepID=A0A9X9X8V9_9PROT|nr:DUF1428 domain-containing protein [Neoroseomonas eburnea]MBR0680145.1 DUF1428 domain-containing protein [Neoroseomonas eburnea]
MTYVDGFVLAVPNANREAYRRHAEEFAPRFREQGAIAMVECWGDDVPDGKLTSFPMAVKCGPEETVVFSWITWPSKEVRDAGWAKIMADKSMQMDPAAMPFDGQRMIYGGFRTIVEQ